MSFSTTARTMCLRALAPCLAIAALLASTHGRAADEERVSVKVHPERVLIEPTRFGQALNFDFEIENSTGRDLELSAVRAAVRDPKGLIIQRLEVNILGKNSGLQILPSRIWGKGETHTIFNPFDTISADAPLGSIDYEFVFRDRNDRKPVLPIDLRRPVFVTATYTVRPTPYQQKTKLILPLAGRVLVWIGHGALTHHRRLDLGNLGYTPEGGVTANADRYSYDLMIVDEDGKFFKGDGLKPEDFLTYGHPVRAPGAGTVVIAVGDNPAVWDGVSHEAGNYIIIDHGNGEFSQIAHLQKGSVKVKAGDRVVAGQVIAAAGSSGSSALPHVHYQVTTGTDFYHYEGLPIRFEDAHRVIGGSVKKEARQWIDSGDIVESEPAKP